ncbi:MAG: YbaK/EbsC family protein [Aeromonadaceae bacterium]|nr:YbaK/EbsC family protein [Aeromonadaceae bacterium]
MAIALLERYLTAAHVPYRLTPHPLAFTAMEIAQRAHVPGDSFAKTVLIRADGQLRMLVMPATRGVDFAALAQALDCQQLTLAREYEFAPLFTDCEPGGEPPLGQLFGLPVYLDAQLLHYPRISFNAGTLREVMELDCQDYLRLTTPCILSEGFMPSRLQRHEHPRLGPLPH